MAGSLQFISADHLNCSQLNCSAGRVVISQNLNGRQHNGQLGRLQVTDFNRPMYLLDLDKVLLSQRTVHSHRPTTSVNSFIHSHNL